MFLYNCKKGGGGRTKANFLETRLIFDGEIGPITPYETKDKINVELMAAKQDAEKNTTEVTETVHKKLATLAKTFTSYAGATYYLHSDGEYWEKPENKNEEAKSDPWDGMKTQPLKSDPWDGMKTQPLKSD
ncbi:TPA: hypothetical protein EYG84_01810, partial [Candidatus Gracilibacteria bacterium]|nr:hypothetical protein [Candidatus Gracilibacteria bacterium]